MVHLDKVEVLGGGPAGLYAATLLKRAMPAARVRITEQNPPDATFGFGVVFSDQALDFLRADDPATYDLITPHMERWRNMTLVHQGTEVVLDGIGFAAIGRLHLLELLQQRAREIGVELRFGHRVGSVDELDGDMIIGADGVNSVVREAWADAFEPHLEHFSNRFAWFGTPRRFETLTQTFRRIAEGHVNAHHYRYTPNMSTFIVELDAATFDALGFGELDEVQAARACEAIFADSLGGAPLVTNRSAWRRFPRLWCARWVAGHRVLLGDAAHTAHFSIGSGTRLAMEDAIALVRALTTHSDLDEALAAFEAARKPIAKRIVDAANSSAAWYEQFGAKMALPPLDFAFDYITRSGRVDLDRLRRLAPHFMAAWDAQHASPGGAEATP